MLKAELARNDSVAMQWDEIAGARAVTGFDSFTCMVIRRTIRRSSAWIPGRRILTGLDPVVFGGGYIREGLYRVGSRGIDLLQDGLPNEVPADPFSIRCSGRLVERRFCSHARWRIMTGTLMLMRKRSSIRNTLIRHSE